MKLLFLSAVLLTSNSSFSSDENKSQCRDFYDQHCSGPNKPMSCFNMDMEDQNMERTDSDVIDEIKEKRDEIFKQARVFGVNPRAIVSSLIAVNTIHPEGMAESITKMLPGGDEQSREMRFGIGRIKIKEFKELEQFSAAYSPRLVNPQDKSVEYRTESEVKELIKSGKSDIEYTAARLKQRQLVYEQGGFKNVSDNIPLMSTIYGLPSVENRVRMHKFKKTNPKINTWGVVSICQDHIIDEILGTKIETAKKGSRLGEQNTKWNHEGVLTGSERFAKEVESTISDEGFNGSRATEN